MLSYRKTAVTATMYKSTPVHKHMCNVVEAHCYALQCRQIDFEQIRSRINQQLIAGRFSHEGLHQLHTKLYMYTADEGLRG